MDYNQDSAINRLHVLDDTNVTCDKNACAIFNGGIYVEKDIHARNIYIKNLKNTELDISNGNIKIINSNTINVANGIYPSCIPTTSTIDELEDAQ